MSTLIQDPNNSANWFAGNTLQGWSQSNFFGTGDQTTTATGQLKTLLNNALGSVERSAMASRLDGAGAAYDDAFSFPGFSPGPFGAFLAFRPNVIEETLTGQIPPPVATVPGPYTVGHPNHVNSRFILRLFSKASLISSFIPIAQHHSINSSSQTVLGYDGHNGSVNPWQPNRLSWYATANHKSVAIFGFTNSNSWTFMWAGLLNSSLAFTYPTRNAIISAHTDQNGTIRQVCFRPFQQDSSTSQSILMSGDANYTIVCSDGTNPTTCNVQLTTLWLRDNATGSPPIGTCDNLLLGKGQSWNIGTPIYVRRKNNSCNITNDPVEGSTTYSYIACARFGTDTLFMRTADAFAPPILV